MNFDLEPHEWKSERPKLEKPREPFWGENLYWFIGVMISIVIVACVKRYILRIY